MAGKSADVRGLSHFGVEICSLCPESWPPNPTASAFPLMDNMSKLARIQDRVFYRVGVALSVHESVAWQTAKPTKR